MTGHPLLLHVALSDTDAKALSEWAEAIISERDQLRADLAALVELGKERDYAMEMVNVQDNQIDALRALLKVAQDCIYSLDAREIYADELARIDAALKDKP